MWGCDKWELIDQQYPKEYMLMDGMNLLNQE